MSGDRLPDLYLEAVELGEAERRELLRRVADESPELAARLERLLAAPDSAPSPIDGSALAAAGVERGDAPPPERVGPYRIVRELGRGGMGRVFLAEQETPHYRRTVALKLIDRPGPDDEAVARFRDEVRILAALDHPNIVHFLHGGRSTEGIWFLAVEYVEGEDLLAHARRHALSIDERVRLFLPVAEAIAYAHERGVVHRDLKPSNVLVGRDGRPRLLDFGVSKLVDPEGPPSLVVTRSGSRLFTPAYASPEQRSGGVATPASDIYSLGVVLFELLAGRRPTGGERSDDVETPSSAARRTRAAGDQSSAAPARGRRERIARELDEICRRALQPDPAGRHPDAAALVADLRSYLARRPAARDAGETTATVATTGRRRLTVLGAVSFAVAAFALAFVATRQRGSEPEKGVAAVAAGRFPFDPNAPPPVEESEQRWAAAPDDLAAGAALVAGLLGDDRLEEARFAVGRLRQVPGGGDDPLADYADGMLAFAAGEQQRALVLYTRALEGALARGRGDLAPAIRVARASMLMRLGQRDAARDELALACPALERAGDDAILHRALNLVALEHARRGETAASEAAYEKAMAAARRTGGSGLIVLGNWADLDRQRGRPDLAEAKLRLVLDARRQQGNRLREGGALLTLSRTVRELGRPAEAAELLAGALGLLDGPGAERALAIALHERSLVDLEVARFDRIPEAVTRLEALAGAELHRRTLGLAREIEGRAAALAGDLAAAETAFAEAGRLLRANGDLDYAATSDLAWAEALAGAGERARARQVLDEALAGFEAPGSTEAGAFASLLLARLDAADARPGDGRARLAALGPDAEASPSVPRRLALLRARAALAAAEHRVDAATADLQTALELARASGRTVDALALRLELARLGSAAAELASARADAAALGLGALAGRPGARSPG